VEFRQQQIKKKRFATANLPRVQGSDSEFCPYSEDVGDQFSANSDSSVHSYMSVVGRSDVCGIAVADIPNSYFKHPNS